MNNTQQEYEKAMAYKYSKEVGTECSCHENPDPSETWKVRRMDKIQDQEFSEGEERGERV